MADQHEPQDTGARPDLRGLWRSFQPRQWFPHGFDASEGKLMWVYRPIDGKFVVGIFFPDGTWMPESTYDNKDAAAARANWLNGGTGKPPEND